MTKTELALQLVSRPIGACPTSFLDAGVGVRYSARLKELRDMGYEIEKTLGCDIVGHHHPQRAYNYRLVGRH